MEGFALIAALALIIMVVIWVLRVPIMIAKTRGIAGSDLEIISILSWCGVLVGITWVIALILAFLWSPAPAAAQTETRETPTDALNKLNDLYNQGIISQTEYESAKRRLFRKQE